MDAGFSHTLLGMTDDLLTYSGDRAEESRRGYQTRPLRAMPSSELADLLSDSLFEEAEGAGAAAGNAYWSLGPLDENSTGGDEQRQHRPAPTERRQSVSQLPVGAFPVFSSSSRSSGLGGSEGGSGSGAHFEAKPTLPPYVLTQPAKPPVLTAEQLLPPDVALDREKLNQIFSKAAKGEGRWHVEANPHKSTGENSSIDVFLAFCTYFRDSTNPNFVFVDASAILSRACYEQWLSTRQKSLKKPEESFRKTVTAHAQGTDGRKPFPPEAERSLLVELRQQKVWDCFKNRTFDNGERMNIGLQGFRGYGYHEKSLLPPEALEALTAKKAGGKSAEAESDDEGGPSRKRKKASSVDKAAGTGGSKENKDKEGGGDDESVASGLEAAAQEGAMLPASPAIGSARVKHNMNEWRTNPVLIQVAARKLKLTHEELFGPDSSVPDVFDPAHPERLVEVLSAAVNPRTVRAAVITVMTRFFLPHQFLALMSISLGTQENDIFEDRILGLDLSIRDPRFDPFFLLTNEDLLPGLPIGTNIFCLQTYVYISADNNSRIIMEGDITGKVGQSMVHPLQFWMIVMQILPRLMQTGELLWQAYTRTQRGRPFISRTRYRLRGSQIITTYQDVTHLFPEIMALPPMDEVIARHLKSKNEHGQVQH
jgi:hypothetical protein